MGTSQGEQLPGALWAAVGSKVGAEMAESVAPVVVAGHARFRAEGGGGKTSEKTACEGSGVRLTARKKPTREGWLFSGPRLKSVGAPEATYFA